MTSSSSEPGPQLQRSRRGAATPVGRSRSSIRARLAAPARCAAVTRRRSWSERPKPSTGFAGWTDRESTSTARRFEWPRLMEFKRSIIASVPASREQGFAKSGIEPFHGRARFTEPTTVVVGSDVLEARHVVVAAGAKPAALGIPGEEHVITSERFLELDQLPSTIAFVGGGYISFEFAHVAGRGG